MSPTQSTSPSTQIAEYLSTLPLTEAREALSRCCGSSRWVEGMLNTLPLQTDQDVFEHAHHIWTTLSPEDYMEAFSHHPQIGADPEQLRLRFKSIQTWSSDEQSGVQAASEQCIQELAQGNRAYLERFGYIFIVCATGKSAQEMLTLLQARLSNSATHELQIAAQEQDKITRLRLEKLIT